MGPVCRSENRSAPAKPTDFSWHLAAIEKNMRCLQILTKTHNDCFILCYGTYRLGTSSLMGFYGHLETEMFLWSITHGIYVNRSLTALNITNKIVEI